MREEDELKIMKKTCRQLVNERDLLTKRRDDKNNKMLDVVPYQNYEIKFNENLMEVVRHNREQAAKITEVEREIRKYHLLSKDLKLANKDKRPILVEGN